MKTPQWTETLQKVRTQSKARRAADRRRSANRLGKSKSIEPLEARMLLAGDTAAVADAELMEQDLVAFAKGLASAGVKLYGSAWCSACSVQKALFEDGAQFLPFIEVTTFDDPDTAHNDLNTIGTDENITTFPTWDFPDGTRRTGVLALAEISDLSGVAIPTSNLPFVVPIKDQTLREGAPLNIGLDGYDPNGGPLIFEVSSDNPNVSATILQGNQSWRLTTNGWGELVFELFEQRATRATNRIIELTNSGYYDGVPFHRIIDNFMIQGGDGENKDGTGGSTLGNYDGQFHPDALHTSKGLLSAANAGDDTNDSQFFITDIATRHLDADHTVFGRLTEGDKIRDAINNTAVGANNRPKTEVRIEKAEVFTDTENAVLLLKTLNGTDSGTATITVTVTDQHGNRFQSSFEVSLTPDTGTNSNTRPYLLDIPRAYTTVDTPVTIQLPAFDAEGDAIVYANANPSNANHTLETDSSTGRIVVTPKNGFTGTLDILVGVRSASSSFDTQKFSVEVLSTAPATVSGTIFNDLDSDGVQDAGEGALRNWTVFVDANDDGLVGSSEAFTITDSNGNYKLTLPEGTTTLKVLPQLGFSATSPTTGERQLTLTAGQVLADQDFGQILSPPTSITLLPASDSGDNNTDDITNATSLEFRVSGLLTGAVVQIFDGNTLVAAGTSNGPTIVIPVSAASALTEGSHAFTARQIVNTTTSGHSAALDVTIDRTVDLTIPNNTLVVVGAPVDVDLQSPEEGEDGFKYTMVSGPSGLSIHPDTGVISWTPTSSQTGSHTVNFKAQDCAGNVQSGSFTLEVRDGISSLADSYNVDEDETLSINKADGVLDNDGDQASGTLSATLVDSPQNGELTFESDGSFTYIPDDDFNGTDTFTYTATDGVRSTGTTTVTINVAAVNDAPIAAPLSFSLFEDTTFVSVPSGVLANDHDVDSSSLSAILVDDVAHGKLTLASTGFFTYIPDTNFTGTDSFTYRASDGDKTSEIVTITLTVKATNDPPVSESDSYQIDEDQLLTVSDAEGVLANDDDPVEGSSLTATLISDVSNGTLTFSSDGSFTYQPNANFNGTDTFTYRASDGEDETDETTVTITVNALNDPPVAEAESYAVNSGETLVIDAASGLLANDTDVEDDPLTVRLITPPASGTLSLSQNGSFNYTAAVGFSGTVTFVYVANDATDDSNEVTVTIEVNNAPIANDDAYEVDEDGKLTVNTDDGLLKNDDDDENNSLSVDLVNGPTDGTLQLNDDGSFEYVPNANFNGTDSFTYTANDPFQTSHNTATVTITVDPVNDVPTSLPNEYRVDRDTTLTVNVANGLLSNDSDIDGDTLSAVVVSQPSHGNLTLAADGSFSYTPDTGFSGVDTFTYRAHDAESSSTPATTVTLLVNRAPEANADSYTTAEDQRLVISPAAGVLDNDTDSEGDAFTATLVDSPDHGTVTLQSDGSFTYTPDANFNGTDSFTYRAHDGSLGSEPATVSINVTPVNDAPVARDDAYSVDEDTPLTVAAVDGLFGGDLDIDADLFTAAIDQSPSHGSLVLEDDGSFTYTPDSNFNGTDSFTYRINDGQLDSNAATVTITVHPVDDAPRFDSISPKTVIPESTVDTTLHANDIDDRGAVFTYSLVSAPDGATIDPVTGRFLWTPSQETLGSFLVTVQATDVSNTTLASDVTFRIDVISFTGLLLLPLTRPASQPFIAPPPQAASLDVAEASGEISGDSTLRVTSTTSSLNGKISRLQASRGVFDEPTDGPVKPAAGTTDKDPNVDPTKSDDVDLPEGTSVDGASLHDDENADAAELDPEQSNDVAVRQLDFSTGDVVSLQFANETLPEWSRLTPTQYATMQRLRLGGAEILSADELNNLARATSRADFQQQIASMAPSKARLIEIALAELDDSLIGATGDPLPQGKRPSGANHTAETAMQVVAAAYYTPLLVSQIERRRPDPSTKLRRILKHLLK